MDIETSFGRWLHARRRALDLTQDDLAQQVGCSVVTIRKIEADERRPSRQIAERLAACLMVAADQRAAVITLARSANDDGRCTSAVWSVGAGAGAAVDRSGRARSATANDSWRVRGERHEFRRVNVVGPCQRS